MQRARISQYEACALREEDAAAQATCRESARLHAQLAQLYRSEAARIAAVQKVMSIAFGD